MHVDQPEFVKQEATGAYLYEKTLAVTLFRPVTVQELQKLTLQFNGIGYGGCVCLFGAQLATSLSSGSIRRVSHITRLTVCAGAGIAPSKVGNGIWTRGQGLQFKPTRDVHLVIREPADERLIRCTLARVVDAARVAAMSSRDYCSLPLQCSSRVLEIFEEVVSPNRN